MFGPAVIFPLNSAGDLIMAVFAAIMGFWTYRNGPKSNRVMLRYWVMAFTMLFLAGLLGAILEGPGASMTHQERMTSRLGLAALYMGAALFQLFAVLEITHSESWGKDLFMGGSGAAYLIIIVTAILYKFPDSKMYFVTYSSTISLGALILVRWKNYEKIRWLLVASAVQLTGVVLYFLHISFLGISHSLLFNLCMFAGLVCYLKGLQEMRESEVAAATSGKQKTSLSGESKSVTTTL